MTKKLQTNFRWIILSLLFIATTILYIDRSELGILATHLQKEIGWNEEQYGIINSSFMVAYAMCFLGMGTVIDRICIKSEPPATLHYALWLGPAPWRPYNEKRGHYNWHWFWDTGNGDTGNQGPHQFDIARWGLNKNEHPVSVYSTGGIYGIDSEECAQETPNTQTSVFKYSDGKMLEFETRGRYTNDESSLGIRIGNMFYGTEGYLELEGGTWKAFRNREKEPFAGSKEGEHKQIDLTSHVADESPADHWANFIDAIRSGKNETLHCDIIEGFYSSALPHLANISYRLGHELKFTDDYEKLANDSEANTMLKRRYRKPYVVPDEV